MKKNLKFEKSLMPNFFCTMYAIIEIMRIMYQYFNACFKCVWSTCK